MSRIGLILFSLFCMTGMALADEARTQREAIKLAKSVLISNFDRNLPRISLEYFLDYQAGSEGGVEWEATPCPITSSPAGSTCVLASIWFRDGRVAMVSLAVSTVGKSVQLRSVMVAYENGAVRELQLIQLPAATFQNWYKFRRIEFSSDVPA